MNNRIQLMHLDKPLPAPRRTPCCPTCRSAACVTLWESAKPVVYNCSACGTYFAVVDGKVVT